MNVTRQDAWTDDEDIILAETVLRYIREGKTQLEAFKDVAEQLSRTSAACGFRWNATIRKKHQQAIDQAKKERKQRNRSQYISFPEGHMTQEKDTLEAAILLLEKMKTNYSGQESLAKVEQKETLQQLKEENKRLKEELLRYEHFWKEMGNLWNWVQKKGEK